jgi:LDH2 family malate/lactate/ureidoglycolate dehydrogenase
MALHIEAFQPLAEFEARMERYVAELKAVPLAPGAGEIFYPGEIEARNDARGRAEGLELPEATLADLRSVARESGVAFDAG